MLVGEYIVLDGGPAVVAAMNCYAKATMGDASEGRPSPFIEAAISLTQSVLEQKGIPRMRYLPRVDTNAFFEGLQKLGLGSSAAATVAVIGAMFHAAGLSLSSASVCSEIQHVAFKAHQLAQGMVGSGADITAATWGGIQVLNSLIQPQTSLPLRFRLVATPTSASTPLLIHKYRKAGDGTKSACVLLTRAAETFLEYWQEQHPPGLLSSIDMAYEGYLALGAALSVPLITEHHKQIHALAKSVGGAAKPSGAGGGDIAIVFFPSSSAEVEFAEQLPPFLSLLPFEISPLGVHTVPSRDGQPKIA